MLNASNPLSTLRDIHLPDKLGFWPWAIGWYGLLVLIILTLVFLGYWLFKRHQSSKPQKEALALLAQYQKLYVQENNTPQIAAAIQALLKRVALVHYPRDQVASLEGDLWITFLNQTGPKQVSEKVAFLLCVVPYQAASSESLTPLFEFATAWIKFRRRYV
jgi:hypothetical protein